MSTTVEPYLTFSGRCAEALEFYQQALGAQPVMVMRFSECPDPLPEGMLKPGWESKIMHAAFRVGDTMIMASDGCDGADQFGGFSLSLSIPDEAGARKFFDALGDGGKVTMPLAKTFWSPLFGMVEDRCGVSWMINVCVPNGQGCAQDPRVVAAGCLPVAPPADRKNFPPMSAIRVLVGTRKGAFILTSDGARRDWTVYGPFFAGWEVYHLKGSPVNPDRLYASQTSGWFGQVMQRSDDGGKTWEAVGNAFAYDGTPGTHQWYDGTQHPWEFKRVWHLEPSLTDPEVVHAGVEDAGLFHSRDGGKTWRELPGLRGHQTGPLWQPGAGGMCLHTILLDPVNPARLFVAISAAGAFRSDDAGATWKPINRGLRSDFLPDPEAEVGHCVHRITQHPARPETLFMQKHWDVMRSDDAGDTWREISGDLPSDFGFPIDVHAHDPETVYVIPITSDSLHFPPEGKLRVYRSRTGGHEWEPLSRGLPQQDCYVNILRDAMAVDRLDPCGVYFGTTGGQVYVSADGGDSWQAIVRDLPAVLSVEVQTLGA